MVRKEPSPSGGEVVESLLRQSSSPRFAGRKMMARRCKSDIASSAPGSSLSSSSASSSSSNSASSGMATRAPKRTMSQQLLSRTYVDFSKNNNTSSYEAKTSNNDLWTSKRSSKYIGISSPTSTPTPTPTSLNKLAKGKSLSWMRKKDGGKNSSAEKKLNKRSRKGNAQDALLSACHAAVDQSPTSSSVVPAVETGVQLISKDDLRAKLRERMLKDRISRADPSPSPKEYAPLSPRPKQDLRKHLERLVPRTSSMRLGKKKDSKPELHITTTPLNDCDHLSGMDFSRGLIRSPGSPSPRLVTREELFPEYDKRDMQNVEMTNAKRSGDQHTETSSLTASVPLSRHNSRENGKWTDLTPTPGRRSRSFSRTSDETYLDLPASPSLTERVKSPPGASPMASSKPATPRRYSGPLQMIRNGNAGESDPRNYAKVASPKEERAQQRPASARDRSSSGEIERRPGPKRFFSFGSSKFSSKTIVKVKRGDDGDNPARSTTETASSSSVEIISSNSNETEAIVVSDDDQPGRGPSDVANVASSVSSANNQDENAQVWGVSISNAVEGRDDGDRTTSNAAPTSPSSENRQSTPTLSPTSAVFMTLTAVKKNRIRLHVYDLIASEAVVRMPWGGNFPLGRCFNAVNSSLHSLGTGAYHCGVEVNGVEYAYGGNDSENTTGVFTCEPMRSPGYQFRTTIDLGERPLIRKIIAPGREQQVIEWHVDGREVLREMAMQYMGKDYDLLRKNCCTFAHDCCLRLGVADSEIPEWFRNLGSGLALTHDAAVSTIQPITKALDGAWCGSDEKAALESDKSCCTPAFLDVSKLRMSLDSGVKTNLDNIANSALKEYEQPALQN